MRNQKQRSATTANVQKCWGPCMAVQAVPGQAALLTHLTSPCTPSPRGWGGQQGLSLPHASFQGKRRAEEGLSQCGGPSQAGTGPSLPESDGGQTWFLLLRERPSNNGHSTITLHRQPCGSVKQEAPGERPGPGRRPGITEERQIVPAFKDLSLNTWALTVPVQGGVCHVPLAYFPRGY